MKYLQYIIPFVIVFFMATGCKDFKKKQVEMIETVDIATEDTLVVDAIPDTPEEKDVYSLADITAPYLIVVGSFESLKYAKKHADKYAQFKYATKVISKPDGYYMVSAQEFDSYEAAHKELVDFRERIAKKSWVFINQGVVDGVKSY
jgi:hypothetical protein